MPVCGNLPQAGIPFSGLIRAFLGFDFWSSIGVDFFIRLKFCFRLRCGWNQAGTVVGRSGIGQIIIRIWILPGFLYS